MRHSLNMILAVSSLVFGMAFSFESSATVKPLTAAQCTALRKDLNVYITLVTKVFGNGPVVQKLIAIAKADVDKLCPPVTPPPGNGWTADTQNECAVPSEGNVTVVSLGLDTGGGISNAISPAKILCISETACNTIVSQKFFIYGASQTSRCSDPNNLTVQHLTDAQVQSKISLLP